MQLEHPEGLMFTGTTETPGDGERALPWPGSRESRVRHTLEEAMRV